MSLFTPEPATPRFGRFARGRHRVPGEMNKLEARYAAELEAQRIAGMILWWEFEGIRLRLTHKGEAKGSQPMFYTPDFFVMAADGELQCHETKGFMEEDAAVKIKTAAEKYPFRFKLVQWRNKTVGWEITEY